MSDGIYDSYKNFDYNIVLHSHFDPFGSPSLSYKEPIMRKKSKAKAETAEANERTPKRAKSLSLHDLTVIKPMTNAQAQMMESYFQGYSILGTGSAGTGKSFIGLYLALNDLLNKRSPINHIKIVRSVVPSRDVGFLPGSLEEKTEVYETPYREQFSQLFGMPTSYDKFKSFGTVEFMSTSFLRGQTWDNCAVVVDEVQNLNFHEINTVMTRIGVDSKVLLLGDSNQSDLYKSKWDSSGLGMLEKALKGNPHFDTVNFTQHDIVRSEFVKAWICGLENS